MRKGEINKTQIADAWLKIALKEIQSKIKHYKIGATHELYNTITGSVEKLSGGDSFKAEILYNFYGIYTDMGVGKGQSREDLSTSKLVGSRRVRKPWTKEIARQSHRFGEILGEATADQAKEVIDKVLKTKIILET